MREELVERVLDAAELVPRGRTATYGDLATIVGTGPRQVGRIMAIWGSAAPWWRITNAKGTLPSELLDEACSRWTEEGIATNQSGTGCDLRHRLAPDELDTITQRLEHASTATEDAGGDTTRSPQDKEKGARCHVIA